MFAEVGAGYETRVVLILVYIFALITFSAAILLAEVMGYECYRNVKHEKGRRDNTSRIPVS